MQKLILAAGIVLMMASAALAGPLCVGGTLTSYINLATDCSIGASVFSAFTASSPLFGATPIAADNILVQPLDTPGPGLRFEVNAMAPAGELLEVLIGYTVTGGTYTGNSLSMAGASATGDGAVTVVEDKCLDGSFDVNEPINCTGIHDTLIVFQIEGDGSTAAQLPFSMPAASVDVFVDITVDGATGSASLTSATTQFHASQVQPIPEPASLGLMVVGLGSVWLLCRRGRRV